MNGADPAARPRVSLHVRNGPLSVGSVRIVGVSASSSFLIGDTGSMQLYSYFDTPPESVVVGPLAPLPPPPDEDIEP